MPAAWISAGGALLGALGSDSSTGAQTTSKEPWKEAQPWILDNIKVGQDLQGYYQNTPFNDLQQNAYRNLFAGSDYVRSLVPSLLSQLQAQPVGFDRSNPSVRPQAFNFGLLGGPGASASVPAPTGGLGLLGDMNVTQNPFRNGAIPAPMATPAPTQAPILGNYIMVGGTKMPVGYDRETYGGAA